ncbi:MAG: RluA family pseudouridine synthase [Patescibacteria group bacterium]
MQHKIKKELELIRIDIFLSNHLKDVSRSQIQKLIKQGNVSVNNKKVSPHYVLRIDDKIIINISKKKKQPTKEVKKKSSALMKKIKIISETEDYLVINKPAGLIVHGAEHINEPTLVDWLLKKYPKIKSVGEDSSRPGIVHRLDRDVSGLMVIAKTNAVFESIKKQFKKREVKKEYTALVYGAINKNEDLINFPIKRASNGYRMVACPRGTASCRPAVTEYQILKKFINYSLLKVQIKTGRTHQIRVHFFAYGYPIVGDNIYATRKAKEKNKKNNLARIFLVATKLAFFNLAGKEEEFKINLPKKLLDFLKVIK